jgi:putative oxidoreductase
MALPNPAPHTDAGLLVLRLTVGVLLLMHGMSKVLHGVAWMSGPLGAVGLPDYLAYGAYIGEVLAPLLLIIGLWTRVAALLIVVDMIMAIFLVRHGDIGKIGMSGGWAIELEAMFLLGALAIALAGGGRFAPGRPAASRR